MDFITYKNRIEYTLELVKKGALQSPNQLAQTFDCSEKTIRRMINNLRDMGHSIEYSNSEKRYLYKSYATDT